MADAVGRAGGLAEVGVRDGGYPIAERDIGRGLSRAEGA
jgi:hypothetical protein